MKLIHFLLAIAVGWFLADHPELTLLQNVLRVVGASLVLTLLTLVVQHVTLPPAARRRGGLTVFQGQLASLFFGTVITIVVTAVALVFIRQRFG